jgi:23S rRNA pseudouridine1911/1915/1917 synthase
MADERGLTKGLRVPAAAAGSRLDAWLADAIEGGTRSAAQRMIEAGDVLVDGVRRSKAHRLAGGETVTARTTTEKGPPARADVEVPVVWEDESLVVVDKPPGLVVHPAPGHASATLVEVLADRAQGRWTPLVVHRLDRDTSGLMMVAKTEPDRRRLREAIARRDVEREYVALVAGKVRSRFGTIDAPIGRDPARRTRMRAGAGAQRAARTHFSLERYVGGCSLVRARLETGRTHQIRAHFAAIGHPVCGDREYGGPGVAGLGRQFLHSARLALAHPRTGERLELFSELPADLARALSALESG